MVRSTFQNENNNNLLATYSLSNDSKNPHIGDKKEMTKEKTGKRTQRNYTNKDKEDLFKLVFVEKMTVASAAREVGMPDSTARGWVKKAKEEGYEKTLSSKIVQAKSEENNNNQVKSIKAEEIEQVVPSFVEEKTEKEIGRETGEKSEKEIEKEARKEVKKGRRVYTEDDHKSLNELVFEDGLPTSRAAKQLGIPSSTAYSWIKKVKEEGGYKKAEVAKANDYDAAPREKMATRIESPKSGISYTATEVFNTNSNALSTKQLKEKVEPVTNDDNEQTVPVINAGEVNKKKMPIRKSAEELNNEKAEAKKSTESKHENHPEQHQSKQKQTLNDKPQQVAPVSSPVKEKRRYRNYTPEERKKLITLVFKENMIVAQAARELQMPDSTARYWVAKHKNSIAENKTKVAKSVNEEQPAEVPSNEVVDLSGVQKEFLINLIDQNPSVSLEELKSSLTDQFSDLKLSNAGLSRYILRKCNIHIFQQRVSPPKKNYEEVIEERFQWANFWARSDLNYGSNCVFLGEAHFYVDTKRSVPWPKPSKEDIKQNIRVLFGAINTQGIVNFAPELSLVDYEKEKDNVTDPYYDFVVSTLEVMDDYYDEFKDNYLVMDNVPMEKREAIEDRIKSCGYGCVFLPSFSSDLNPVENLWPAVKRMLKRDQLIEFENLSSRIAEACDEITATELRGLCEYSYFKLANCLNRKPF